MAQAINDLNASRWTKTLALTSVSPRLDYSRLVFN